MRSAAAAAYAAAGSSAHAAAGRSRVPSSPNCARVAARVRIGDRRRRRQTTRAQAGPPKTGPSTPPRSQPIELRHRAPAHDRICATHGGRWQSDRHGEPEQRSRRETNGTEPDHLQRSSSQRPTSRPRSRDSILIGACASCSRKLLNCSRRGVASPGALHSSRSSRAPRSSSMAPRTSRT